MTNWLAWRSLLDPLDILLFVVKMFRLHLGSLRLVHTLCDWIHRSSSISHCQLPLLTFFWQVRITWVWFKNSTILYYIKTHTHTFSGSYTMSIIHSWWKMMFCPCILWFWYPWHPLTINSCCVNNPIFSEDALTGVALWTLLFSILMRDADSHLKPQGEPNKSQQRMLPLQCGNYFLVSISLRQRKFSMLFHSHELHIPIPKLSWKFTKHMQEGASFGQIPWICPRIHWLVI